MDITTLLKLYFGGSFASLIAMGFFAIVLISLSIYIYTSFAWMVIGKRLGYDKPWLAWIPIANIAMMLQLANYHWAWVFLVFIPILGWIALGIMTIIAQWRIFKKLNYPGWLILLSFIPFIGGFIYLIIIGLVAWTGKNR